MVSRLALTLRTVGVNKSRSRMAASMTLLATLFHLTSKESILPLFKQPESCTIKEKKDITQKG